MKFSPNASRQSFENVKFMKAGIIRKLEIALLRTRYLIYPILTTWEFSRDFHTIIYEK